MQGLPRQLLGASGARLLQLLPPKLMRLAGKAGTKSRRRQLQEKLPAAPQQSCAPFLSQPWQACPCCAASGALAGQLAGSAAECSKGAAEEWAFSACFARAASGCKLAGLSPCRLPLRLGLLRPLLARRQLAASGGRWLSFFPPPRALRARSLAVPLVGRNGPQGQRARPFYRALLLGRAIL